MAKKRTPRTVSILYALIDGASAEALRNLVRSLATQNPDVATACPDTLSSQLPADAPQKADTAATAARSLWSKADMILDDLNTYGGGPGRCQAPSCSCVNKFSEVQGVSSGRLIQTFWATA